MREAAGASFDFLSDADGRWIDFFGVRHAGGRVQDGGDIAQSAGFLVDGRGRLVWQRLAVNYRVRPKPEEILAAADQALGG